MTCDWFIVEGIFCKEFIERCFLKKANAQNLQNTVQTLAQFQLLANDGNQNVNTDGDPDLGLHGVDRGSIETANPQVLLDPLEEQFDLPSALVELGDGEGWQSKMIGQKNQMSLLLDIEEVDASQTFRIISLRVEASQSSNLVGTHTGDFVDWAGLVTNENQVVFGPDHEEGHGLVDSIEPCKIQVSAIHDIEGSGLDDQLVENVHVVEFSLGNGNETGNWPSQVQQGMELDRGFGSSKPGPAKQAQTQIDGGRIQSVNRFVQLDPEIFGGIEPARLADKMLGQIGINSPIPLFVGTRQIHARHMAADPQTVKLTSPRTQTSFDVAQAFPIGQLSKAHTQKLIPATEPLNFVHAPISIDVAFELLRMNPLHQLRKNGRLNVHEPILRS